MPFFASGQAIKTTNNWFSLKAGLHIGMAGVNSPCRPAHRPHRAGRVIDFLVANFFRAVALASQPSFDTGFDTASCFWVLNGITR